MVGLAGLLVALVVPLLPAAPPDVPELELSTQEAAPGDEVGVIGRGYGGCIPQGQPTDTPEPEPDSISGDTPSLEPPPVILRWESLTDRQELGEAALDDYGSFSTTITVPADAGAEPYYEVSASCSPGPGEGEIFESAVIVVVVPPPPITTTPPPPTSDPPPPPEPTVPTGTAPTGTVPTETVPTPLPTPGPYESAAREATSSGSDVLLAAFVAVLVVGLGLLGLIRALRRRPQRHSRAPSVTAVVAPAPPGLLDVRPRGPERTVALRVVVRAEPGVLSVDRSKE